MGEVILRGLFAAVMLGWGAQTVAQGQDRPEPTVPTNTSAIPIDFLPPGARALGLAGAFTAVADDATAAEANPAGLTILSAPEVSVHLRDSDNSIDFYDAEARNPEQFGSGPGRLLNSFDDSTSGVSFASVVVPLDRFVFSGFYTSNADLSAVATPDELFNPDFIDTFLSEQTLAAELESFGLSTAFRVNDLLSIGLTVKQTELTLSALDQQTIDNFRDFEFIFAREAPQFTAEQYAAGITDRFVIGNLQQGDDSDITYNLGVLLNPAGKWSAGFVYKEGGSYDIGGTGFFTQSLGCVPGAEVEAICNQGFTGIDLSEFNRTESQNIPSTIDLPDTMTLGFAWRPDAEQTWLLSFDINRIEYSSLPQPRRVTLGFEFPVDGGAEAVADDIEPIDDVTNYHFGVEKVFPLGGDFLNLISVRGGVFTTDDRDGTRLLDTDDETYTFGLGAVLAENFQVDFAYSTSDLVDNLVLSGIYRF